MKKLLAINLFTLLTILCISVSCKKDDDVTPAVISSTIPGSGWKVSLFSEPSENKTNDFSGYQLEFGDAGKLTVTGNGVTVTGTWQQHQNDGVTKFLIALDTNDKKLSDLNHDWVIVAKTDALIDLKDDNASSNEQLKFTK